MERADENQYQTLGGVVQAGGRGCLLDASMLGVLVETHSLPDAEQHYSSMWDIVKFVKYFYTQITWEKLFHLLVTPDVTSWPLLGDAGATYSIWVRIQQHSVAH